MELHLFNCINDYNDKYRNCKRNVCATELRSKTRTWDSLGRPATLTNTLGTFTYGYLTALSRLDSLTRPGGITTAYAYKANNAPGHSSRALESITHTLAGPPATTLASNTYGYDPAGRITSWQSQGTGMEAVTRTFGHNLGDELTRATKTRDSDAAVLDRTVGTGCCRELAEQKTGSAMETRTLNSMNRLTAIGGSGSTEVEGTVNEFARVTVNGAAAQVSKVPMGAGFRYSFEYSLMAGTLASSITG